MTRKDRLLPFASSVPWGCSFLFFKLLGTALPPVTIALGRVGIAAAVLWSLLAAAGGLVPVTAPVLGNLALHEPMTLNALGGAGIILAGLALLDGRWLPRIEDA